MPFRIGPWEIGLILVIILIVFGVGKLPLVSEAVGKGLRAFRRGQSGRDETDKGDKKNHHPKRLLSRKVDKS